jgi:hypothetical protein
MPNYWLRGLGCTSERLPARNGFCFAGTGATRDPRRSPQKLIGDAFAVAVDAEPVATAPERVTFGS